MPGTGLVGIATSRDIGKAARRNRQRRRVREALRGLLKPDRTFDLIVSVPDTAYELTPTELTEVLQKLVSSVESEK